MKYTIELTENQKKQMDFMLDMANKHMGFNRKLEMIETTNVEDTDEYQIGYKAGRKDGFAYCRYNTELTEELKQVEYNKGVEDFENLFVHEHDYEQFFKDTYVSKDPDYNLYDLVAEYGAKKVLKDFKKWQEEKKKADEIKVGDVIYSEMTDSKAIIISFDAWDNWNCIDTCGTGFVINESKMEFWKKIGHIDEVSQLLDKLRGE